MAHLYIHAVSSRFYCASDEGYGKRVSLRSILFSRSGPLGLVATVFLCGHKRLGVTVSRYAPSWECLLRCAITIFLSPILIEEQSLAPEWPQRGNENRGFPPTVAAVVDKVTWRREHGMSKRARAPECVLFIVSCTTPSRCHTKREPLEIASCRECKGVAAKRFVGSFSIFCALSSMDT